MTRLCFTEIHEEPLYGASFDLGPGLHVVLGDENADGARLIELAAGLAKPRHGRVEIDHQQPYYSPELRAKIGCLLPDPNLPAAKTVAALVAGVLKLKAALADPQAFLADWQLGSIASRSTLSLRDDESRSLALALALATPNPTLLCCYQPFDTLLPRERVRERLQSAADKGAIVLVTTNRVELNVLLPANVLLLSHGRLLRATRAEVASDLMLEGAPTVLVVSSDTRALASVLTKDARVTALAWDVSMANGALRVWSADVKGVSDAIVEAALVSDVQVSYLGNESLSLSTVQAAAYQEIAPASAWTGAGTDVKG
jgi:ABC-type multidrug transport system ATPase subunit